MRMEDELELVGIEEADSAANLGEFFTFGWTTMWVATPLSAYGGTIVLTCPGVSEV